jgi:hypothetical protein
LSGIFIVEPGAFGERIQSASCGIGAVENRALAFDELQVIEGKGIDGVPVLDRSAAESGIVDADTVDKEQVLPSRQTTDERRTVTIGGLLHENAGCVDKSIR